MPCDLQIEPRPNMFRVMQVVLNFFSGFGKVACITAVHLRVSG